MSVFYGHNRNPNCGGHNITMTEHSCDLCDLETKLATVQSSADRLAEAARAIQDVIHEPCGVDYTELFAALAAHEVLDPTSQAK